MTGKKLSSDGLICLFNKVKIGDETSIGTYKYGKLKIIIGKIGGTKTGERVMRRYHRLRIQGLCTYCGKRKAKKGRLCKVCKPKIDRRKVKMKVKRMKKTIMIMLILAMILMTGCNTNNKGITWSEHRCYDHDKEITEYSAWNNYINCQNETYIVRYDIEALELELERKAIVIPIYQKER